MRPPEHPRFALVAWPDDTIGCLFLSVIDDAVARGASVFAREFDRVPDVPLNMQQNPIRHDDGDEDGA